MAKVLDVLHFKQYSIIYIATERPSYVQGLIPKEEHTPYTWQMYSTVENSTILYQVIHLGYYTWSSNLWVKLLDKTAAKTAKVIQVECLSPVHIYSTAHTHLPYVHSAKT